MSETETKLASKVETQSQAPPPEIIRATAASLQSMLGMAGGGNMPSYISDDVNRLAASLEKWAEELEAARA